MFTKPLPNETYEEYIGRIKDFRREGYVERHHIKPKCCGGLNDPENLISLYPEEHFYAHMLLYKENPNNHGLAEAFLLMAQADGHDGQRGQIKILAEEFGELKRAAAKKHGERMKGHEVSAEQRAKISAANSKPRPEWAKKKQSEMCQGRYQNGENPNARKIFFKEKNKTYDCIKEFCEENGISTSTVYWKIYENKDKKELYFPRKKITLILL